VNELERIVQLLMRTDYAIEELQAIREGLRELRGKAALRREAREDDGGDAGAVVLSAEQVQAAQDAERRRNGR
jgi:hypothetical protein